MPPPKNDHLVVSTHDFKTNFSRYVRLLEQGIYRSIVVRRGKKVIGIFVPNRLEN